MNESRSSGTERWRRSAGTSIGRLVLLGTLLVGIVASLPPGVAAQGEPEAPATAALVPEDAAAYVAVDLRLESDQWAQTQALLARAGFPEALTDLRDTILVEAGIAEAGSVPADDPLFGGELGVVVTGDAIANLLSLSLAGMATGSSMEMASLATPTPGEAGGVVAILAPGDADAGYEVARDLFRGDDAGAATELEETTYEGVTIESTPSDADSDPGAIARVDDFVLLAATPADLEPIIDAAQGNAPTLADFEPLADVRAELGDEHLLFAFVNGQVVYDAYPPEFVAQVEALSPMLAQTGTQDSYMGVALRADDPGFRIESVMMAADGASFDDILPDAGFAITADERVPDDTFLFLGGANIGPSGAFAGVTPIIAAAVNEGLATGTPEADATPTEPFGGGSAEDLAAEVARAEETLGFDLQDDLFGQLVDEFVFAFSLPGLGGGNLLDFGFVVASGTDEEATVADSLARLARVIDARGEGVDVSTRTVAGDRVFVLEIPDATGVPAFEFGVVGEDALFGTRTGVDDFVEGPAAPLAEDERYQRVLDTLGGEEPFQIVYVDLSQIAPFLAEFAGATAGGSGVVDADPACGDFDDAATAQAAFEADPIEQATLDQDFDGEACEDFFVTGTPVATPAVTGPEAIEALAAVSYERDGMIVSSAILAITEQDR